MKTCSRCKEEKRLAEFSNGGKANHCKSCHALSMRIWRAANPDATKAALARYKQKHPERIKAISKAYYEKNADLLAAKNREWYQRNSEYAKSKSREWREANVERVRATLNTLRVNRNKAVGSFTAQDVAKLRDKQGDVCAGCFSGLSAGYHVDHIIPLSKGGTSWPENLQLLCPTCNRRKGRKMPEQWMPLAATLAKLQAAGTPGSEG